MLRNTVVEFAHLPTLVVKAAESKICQICDNEQNIIFVHGCKNEVICYITVLTASAHRNLFLPVAIMNSNVTLCSPIYSDLFPKENLFSHAAVPNWLGFSSDVPAAACLNSSTRIFSGTGLALACECLPSGYCHCTGQKTVKLKETHSSDLFYY